jgi:glycosyltransferase involved in cell wall biosynthesis
VTVRPANRGYPDETQSYPAKEKCNGVAVRRVWRPRLSQKRNLGRLANAGWMILAWGCDAFRRPRPDAVIIGTDPVLGVLAAVPWKLTRPGVAVAHWGFDIYPEASIADGMMGERSPLVRAIRAGLTAAYRCCDAIIDIGPCMRELIGRYGSRARVATLVPWALVEPARPAAPDPGARAELFGGAKLGLLYSGTFGRAHGYEQFLALARRLRGAPIAFCFAGRGNRADQLRSAVTPDDTNIRFAGFAAESELEKRLGAADVHLTSLQPEWTGTVVPSKFFGSLATGRPVVFAGSPDAAIARWVREFDVGWLLAAETIDTVADELRTLANDPKRLSDLQDRCHRVYQREFARDHVIDGWNAELRQILRRSGFRS